MGADLLHSLRRLGRRRAHAVSRGRAAATRPSAARLVVDTLAALPRSTGTRSAETALVRQQLVVLRRSGKRVPCTPTDRTWLVLLARRVRTWRHALLIVQPETLLRWHRQGVRLVWRRLSRAPARTATPKGSAETIALSKERAAATRLWGAARIHGELLTLDSRVATTTVQRSMRAARPRRGSGQTWSTVLRPPAVGSWACDVLPATDLLVRQIYAFFLVAVATRRGVPRGVTWHPTDSGVAQPVRAAPPCGQPPT